MSNIRIITTGGTFDKYYDAVKGELTFSESHLPRIIAQSRMEMEIELEGPLAKDSLYMNDDDRRHIIKSIEESPETRIIVIHGTDTMTVTAALVAETAKGIEDKTVVFTGAMIPYSLENSDAVFNLGYATACAEMLPSGVYIAMGGHVYEWDKVAKNRARGAFEGEPIR